MAAVRPFSGRKGASVRTPDEKTRCTQLEPCPKSCQPQRTHAAGGIPPPFPPPCRRGRGGGAGGGGMWGGRMHRIVRGSRLRARPDRRRQLSSQDTVGKTAHPVKKTTVPASRLAPATRATRRQRLGRCSHLLYVSRAEDGHIQVFAAERMLGEALVQWPSPTSMLRHSRQ